MKYEDIRTAQNVLKKGGFMFKFDLKLGYHHVDIHPSHNKLLGFAWNLDGKTTYFRFKCLPLVKKWRSEGKDIVVYLNDALRYANNYAEEKSVIALEQI